MSDQIDTRNMWLTPEEIAGVRNQVPLIYIDAVPVRVNADGVVTHVGLLLRLGASC